LHEVVDALEADQWDRVERCVAITFDDGSDLDYHDITHPTWGPQRGLFGVLHDHAQRNGALEATSFAIVSPSAREELDRRIMIGARWWNDDWWSDAEASGLMRVESHSWDHNHECLSTRSAEAEAGTFDLRNFEDADAEIRLANDYLCRRRGRGAPVLFAYPYGRASDYLAREYLPRGTGFHGVRAAFTTEGVPVSRKVNRWLVPRLMFQWHWKSPDELERILKESMRSAGVPGWSRDLPVEVEELPEMTHEAAALFTRSFRAPPPREPRHFAAYVELDGKRNLCGYIHYTVSQPGVFLLGGLCIDSGIYRRLTRSQRAGIAELGSLSRILLVRSIAALGAKRAVLAYTGHTMSRRDCAAVGFVQAGQRLIVQWHDEPLDQREELLAAARALGPF
jgi:peptidoglycan/xylan/chitin deacetylase (PgdA/CDA1 family)